MTLECRHKRRERERGREREREKPREENKQDNEERNEKRMEGSGAQEDAREIEDRKKGCRRVETPVGSFTESARAVEIHKNTGGLLHIVHSSRLLSDFSNFHLSPVHILRRPFFLCDVFHFGLYYVESNACTRVTSVRV